MEIKRMTAEMDYVPVDFQVRNFGNSCFEIMQNKNVVREESGERVIYKAETTLQTAIITTKSEGVVALIRMVYSQDDEFALINKGISDPLNNDYIRYREYVNWCKEQANIYFSEVI
jgi:hypothetical protein